MKPLNEDMDAKRWTDEFMRLHSQGQQSLDWAEMMWWFANAIMCGSDITRWKMEKEISQLQERIKQLKEWVCHSQLCILSRWEQGEPTPDGGYRTMYDGKWYQNRPVDETPKCNCGLDEIL